MKVTATTATRVFKIRSRMKRTPPVVLHVHPGPRPLQPELLVAVSMVNTLGYLGYCIALHLML